MISFDQPVVNLAINISYHLRQKHGKLRSSWWRLEAVKKVEEEIVHRHQEREIGFARVLPECDLFSKRFRYL